jgi:two-component system cell cycle sensor histidine kinase/response regulator CckA
MSSSYDPRLEAQLRRAQKMELAGRLACGLAHDFNNLLQVIAACLDGLASQPGDAAQVVEHTRQASQALDMASDVVRRLAAFGRPDDEVRRPTDLNEIVDSVVGLCRPLAGSSIEVAVRYQPQALMVRVSPGQIEQALMNVCVNARDAMPNGGALNITTQAAVRRPSRLRQGYGGQALPAGSAVTTAAWAMIEVSDTGAGIPVEIQNRVFEPFFTTKARGEGSGLGLAMVGDTIRSHGGFVEFSSACGVGTVFRLFLPLCRL